MRRFWQGSCQSFLTVPIKKTKRVRHSVHANKECCGRGAVFRRARAPINSNVVPPMWLESEEPAGDWIVCRNMLVNPWTEETRKFTPDLFARGGVDWDWNVEAECP